MGNPAGVRRKNRLKRVRKEAERLARKTGVQPKSRVAKVLTKVEKAADSTVK
jgi:hypothetical protein